jgi:hypothetical protein
MGIRRQQKLLRHSLNQNWHVLCFFVDFCAFFALIVHMIPKRHLSLQISGDLFERLSTDAARFKFSMSDLVRRVLENFYAQKQTKNLMEKSENSEGLGSPITWQEMDELSEEAGRADNPYRFTKLEDALEFLHGEYNSRIF